MKMNNEQKTGNERHILLFIIFLVQIYAVKNNRFVSSKKIPGGLQKDHLWKFSIHTTNSSKRHFPYGKM